MGAGQYGTAKVFDTIVPPLDAQEWRQSLHQVMAPVRKTAQEGVRGVERRGSHRAHKLDAPLDHDRGQGRLHCFPAHCGPHLNPIEGVWRVRKEAMGAGRGFGALPQLSQRTRRVLRAHHERPM
jgi:hypothetical protein